MLASAARPHAPDPGLEVPVFLMRYMVADENAGGEDQYGAQEYP